VAEDDIEEWVELMNTASFNSEDVLIQDEVIANDRSFDWFQSFRELGPLLNSKIEHFFDLEDEENEEEPSENSSQNSNSISKNSPSSSQPSPLQLNLNQSKCVSSNEQVAVSFKEKCDGKSEVIQWLHLNEINSTATKFLTINLDSSKCSTCRKNRKCKTHLITLDDLLDVTFTFEASVMECFRGSGRRIVFENVLDQEGLLLAVDPRLRLLTQVNSQFGGMKLILLTPLNSCQFRAVQKIRQMVNNNDSQSDGDDSQHLQVLLGAPGTGKSFVIQSLKKIFKGEGEVLINCR
jgi:hypothetical protein